MKKLYFSFLFYCILFSSCVSIETLYNERKYSEAFATSINRVKRNPLKTEKYKPLLFSSFYKANYDDMYKINNKYLPTENITAANKLIDKIKKRQNDLYDIRFLLAIENKDSIPGWIDVSQISDLINKKAFNIYKDLFDKNFGFLLEGKKENLPKVLGYLNSMLELNAGAMDYDSISLMAQTLGHTYTQVEYNNKTCTEKFNSLISNIQLLDLSNYQNTLFFGDAFDRVDQKIVFNLVYVDPGNESYRTSATHVCEKVQDGCETVTEEVWENQPPIIKEIEVEENGTIVKKRICEPQPPIKKIITKQVPRYITVSATVFEETLEKEAKAIIEHKLFDMKGTPIKSGTIHSNYSDSDYDTYYVGDSRAVFGVSPVRGFLSVKNDFQMLERLKINTQNLLHKFLEKEFKINGISYAR